MSSALWDAVLPQPRVVVPATGTWTPPAANTPRLAAYGTSGIAAAHWLEDALQRCGICVATVAAADSAAEVHVGLIDDLLAAGLVGADWRSARPFIGPCADQGYILEVRPDRVLLAAGAAPGLQYAAATLLQVLQRVAGNPLPCVRIEDWPEIPWRGAADWLLNAEINRWGLERGDGLAALRARMERKLDLAARLKINLVWFDGFGWDPDRAPGYAALVRDLARSARRRHIRLAHAGYGGGYGFAYQKHFIYEAPYFGRFFENRRSYPDGAVYDCVGHPGYPDSWRYGTCLSNQALADAKIAELAAFVRQCEPGLLYIHDIDTGTFDGAWQGWKRRCPECRARWPADQMTAPDGAAGAYAQWYRQVSTALNQVRSEDGTYLAGRDCQLVFVGPVYTDADDDTEVWRQQCEYFGLVSSLVDPFANLQFGIREQVLRDGPGPCRVAQLADRLDQAGNGHGVFVVAFTGGDNYYSDTLVPPGAALQGNYRGARTCYVKSLGAVFEPAQALCAEYAWNPEAPGAVVPPVGRDAGLILLSQSRSGQLTPPGWLGTAGLLHRACALLYGEGAAASLARLGALGLGQGTPPLATAWGTLSRDVAALLGPPPRDLADRASRWQRRAESTATAADLAAGALCELRDAVDRDDVQWLRTRLEISRRFCELLGRCWQWRASPSRDTHAAACEALQAAEAYLSQHVGRDTVDPVGGDVTVWQAITDRLRALLG